MANCLDPGAVRTSARKRMPASKRKGIVDDTEQDQKKGKTMETPTETFREDVDLAGQKHGPKFLESKQEKQQWIIKLHKNLGHPGSNQKLQTFCQQLKCGKHIMDAIPDLRCSARIERKQPVVPRPAVVHEERDFGDVVSMDGVTWTNKAGKRYHFVDHSTTFQTAFWPPSRTAESAIRAITLGWISWGGPPGLLCVDSAGEFCNEEFNSFLQRHNIKLRMVPPEASWQNDSAEKDMGGYFKKCTPKYKQRTVGADTEVTSRTIGFWDAKVPRVSDQ